MQIKFLGAAGTVTGSGYILTADSGQSILIDLGMFQGEPEIEALNYAKLDLDGAALSGVVLTHAHLDHCGRLPMLEKRGFKGNVFMTAPTADLTELSLYDSAKIAQMDHPDDALYTAEHVEKLVRRFRIAAYKQPFTIGEFTITFFDAGHLLGAASALIEVEGRKLVFSGDLGNTPQNLVCPTDYLTGADTVIMESTYGDSAHPAGSPEDAVQAEINAIEGTRGTLLIPSFSLDRTQELLHIIFHLKARGLVKPETPIYTDSPMGEKATHIYRRYSSMLNEEVKKDFLLSDPFIFPGLRVVASHKESQELSLEPGPKVIIAGAGMMTGGRVVSHAMNLLPVASTRLFLVGYQGVGTLGRQLQEGATVVEIDGQAVAVHAQINHIRTMSSHADQPKLLNWLTHIKGVTKVILTHGEDGPRAGLAAKIQSDTGISDVVLPTLNQEVVI